MANSKQYGCAMLILDLILIFATLGLWIIWIIIRQWRAAGR